MLMGGDVHGDWEIGFFNSMTCSFLTMNNCGKLQEGFSEGVDWILLQFQSIKWTSVAFTINKMIQGCVVMVDGFKRSDVVGASIFHGSADNMVLNPTLDFLSGITLGGWNIQGENRILIYGAEKLEKDG